MKFLNKGKLKEKGRKHLHTLGEEKLKVFGRDCLYFSLLMLCIFILFLVLRIEDNQGFTWHIFSIS